MIWTGRVRYIRIQCQSVCRLEQYRSFTRQGEVKTNNIEVAVRIGASLLHDASLHHLTGSPFGTLSM